MKWLVLSGSLILNSKNEIYLLFRKKHSHYETPGGKVDEGETPEQAARRELFEEVKGIKEITSMEYFDEREIILRDGRKAKVYKFITKIKGSPEPNEDLFDKEKSGWISINKLENKRISPTVEPLISKLKKFISQE